MSARRVNADATGVERCQQLKQPARTGAEVEQRVELTLAECADDRCLDRIVGDMEGADRVPIRRVVGEVALRRLGVFQLHRGEALPVARQHGIADVDQRQKIGGEPPRRSAVSETIEDPRAFRMAVDQPCL